MHQRLMVTILSCSFLFIVSCFKNNENVSEIQSSEAFAAKDFAEMKSVNECGQGMVISLSRKMLVRGYRNVETPLLRFEHSDSTAVEKNNLTIEFGADSLRKESFLRHMKKQEALAEANGRGELARDLKFCVLDAQRLNTANKAAAGEVMAMANSVMILAN